MKGRLGDAGISQVIAVITLVAVTAALAAGLAILLSPFFDESDPAAPSMGIVMDERQGTLLMARATWSGGALTWEDLEVTGCDTSGLSGPVVAGQRVPGCTGQVTILHAPTNALLFAHEMP